MIAISEKRLYPEIRNEIVRDLVTHMYGHVDKPDTSLAMKVGNLLVEQYPFMADSVTGSGSAASVSAEGIMYYHVTLYFQGSWVKKIMDRVYNIEKSRKRKTTLDLDETPRKRGRPKRSLDIRYPSITPGDASVQQQQVQAISKELEKEKPRKDILLPLMKTTFYARRQYILANDDSVITKLEKFPALRMPPLVCLINVFL